MLDIFGLFCIKGGLVLVVVLVYRKIVWDFVLVRDLFIIFNVIVMCLVKFFFF